MGNQAGIIIRNVKNELFHSAKRLILNEVKGIECLPINMGSDFFIFSAKLPIIFVKSTYQIKENINGNTNYETLVPWAIKLA